MLPIQNCGDFVVSDSYDHALLREFDAVTGPVDVPDISGGNLFLMKFFIGLLLKPTDMLCRKRRR